MRYKIIFILLLMGMAIAQDFDFQEHIQQRLPQTKLGEQRFEKLSLIRNELLQIFKEKRLENVDSILKIGDDEFGKRIWISANERLLIYLIIGGGEKIKKSKELRNVLWGNNRSFGYMKYPQSCLLYGSENKFNYYELGYAPDLIDHLRSYYQDSSVKILDGIKNKYPDLVEFISLCECDDVDPKPFLGDAQRFYTKKLVLFSKKYPNSEFTEDILENTSIDKKWTGNGMLFGGGPSYNFFDSKTNTLISDGAQGNVFVDFNFPLLKLGLDFQVRAATPKRSFALDDTIIGTNVTINFIRTIISTGYSFKAREDLFITPFSGLLISNFGIPKTDEKKIGRSFDNGSIVGIPVGVKVDYLVLSWGDKGWDGEGRSGLGMRLDLSYEYGRWNELEPGLGMNAFGIGLRIFSGIIGISRI